MSEITKLKWRAVSALTGGCYELNSDDGRLANIMQIYLRDIRPKHPANQPKRVAALAYEKCIMLQAQVLYTLDQLNELGRRRRSSIQRRWDKRKTGRRVA